MLPVVAAVVIGALIGGIRPAHGAHLRTPILVYPAVVVVGALAHAGLGLVESGLQGSVLGVSLAMLTGFAAVNRHVPGMGVLTIGLVLNMTVVLANGAMPVRASALVDAGVASAEELADTDPGAGRRFAQNDDVAEFLGDIIPVEPFGAVMSFGDLIALMGIGAVSGELMRHARRGTPSLRRRRRLESEVDGEPSAGFEPIGVPERGQDVEELPTLIDLVDAEDRVRDDACSERHGRERPGVTLTR